MHGELLVNLLNVAGDRVARDFQELGDLAKGKAFGNERQHFGFARRQTSVFRQRLLGRNAGRFEALQQLPRDDRRDR